MAVICVHVLGTQCACKRTANPFNSIQNCLYDLSFFFFVKWLVVHLHWFEYYEHCGYLKCSYFQTPSSWVSGIVNIASMFDGSFLINCCINCCTANVLSISSNGSSGQRQKSYVQKRKIRFSFGSLASIVNPTHLNQLINKDQLRLYWIPVESSSKRFKWENHCFFYSNTSIGIIHDDHCIWWNFQVGFGHDCENIFSIY